MAEWKELTRLTSGSPLLVEKVRIPESGIAIEGQFELPPLAQLSLEDQVFVGQFIKCHGSIKEMERLFDVSYPTIKNRLNKISERLGHTISVETNPEPSTADVLRRLESGEITAKEAIEALRK